MTKRVIVSGDFHIGNMGALCPEEVIINEDIPSKRMVYTANETQKKILRIYEELCDEYRNPDVLMANGDLIDGANYKESGLGVFTTDLNLQAELFEYLIDYLKPRKIIGTTGSKYHSGANPNMDQVALEKVGGEFKGGYGIIDVNGCRIYAQHKIAVSKSTWQYRSTPLGRAIVLARLADETYGKINILCKSHAHYFNYVGFSDCLGMIMPCWKAYDPFGDTAIEFNNPAVGYVVFDVESDGSYQFNYNIQHFKQSELNPDVVI